MLTRDDIARIHDAELARFVKNPPENPHLFSVRVTSGTTGGAPIVALADHRISLATFSPMFWEKARVLLCVGTRSLRFFYTALASERPEISNILTLDRDDLRDGLTLLIEDFSPEKIIGFPTFIIEAGVRMRREDASRIIAVACVGERITPEYESRLKELFPNARLSWFYGVIEMRNLSKESCAFLRPNHFHPNIGVTIRVTNENADGFGDILVSTTIGKTAVEDYAIGDIARFLPSPCPCGEEITIELAARRGFDYLKLGGALLVQDEFDRVMRKYAHAIHDYRVEGSMVPQGATFIGKLRILAFAPRNPTQDLQQSLIEGISSQLFLTADRTLADLVKDEKMLPLSLEWTQAPFPDAYKAARMRIV